MRRLIEETAYCIIAAAACVAIVLALGGCRSPFGTTIKTPKTVYFAEGSITLNPVPCTVSAVEGEDADGAEMVFPDGSYVTLSGGGSAGNLMLVIMQNDGTEARTDAAAKAGANVNSPSATATAGGAE